MSKNVSQPKAFNPIKRYNESWNEGYQKKYLKGLAHSLKPTVFVGQKGAVPSVIKALDEALDTHELIKVKFIEFKEKSQKEEIAGRA